MKSRLSGWPRAMCWALAAGLLLQACGKQPPRAAVTGPAALKSSDRSARESVAVTIYNQNFGVVREIRRLQLGTGLVELSYEDVAAQLQPETVRIQSLGKGDLLRVLEQNYRYDLLTPAKLLEKHVGKRVSVYRYDEKTGVDTKKEAEVLSVEGGVTLRIDGEVTTNFVGRFAFEQVPPNLLEKPTLVWLLESSAAEQRVEVTYLTRNLNWQADYVLKLDANDRRADLTGWVTLDNQSGVAYENASLRLVAGDVNRVQPPAPPPMPQANYAPEAVESAPTQFKQEGLFEYHLYSLQRPTSILDKETKQVSLLQASGVEVKKQLIFEGQPYYFRGQYGQLAAAQKVGVFVELDNSEKNRLGLPLPKGTLRVYKADAGGALQFVGEDAVDHTARDESLKVKLGEAFDVVGDRKQTEWLSVSSCVAESAYAIELRNHKDQAETVQVREAPGAGFELLKSSHAAVKEDAATLRFDVAVPARGKASVTYRVRVRFC